MKEAMKWFRHNSGLAVGIVICLLLVVYMVGCESQVASLVNPDQMVTRAELKIELDGLMQTAEYRVMELDRQDAIKQQIGQIGATLIQGGTVNPGGLVLAGLGIVGLGAVADNRKKDSIIKTLKPA